MVSPLQVLQRCVRCPSCGSEKIWRDGFRVLRDGRAVQRYLCRTCGFRFSFSERDKNMGVRSGSDLKMAQIGKIQRFAGVSPRVREKLIEFLWWMRKQGYRESTIISRSKKLWRLVRLGADLLNPESVKLVVAKQRNWTESHKETVVCAYDLFVKWLGLQWDKPRYRRVEKLPFIPLEKEVDALIAGCTKYVSTFLQICKETAARPGEIFALKWSDVDFEKGIIRINDPEKHSKPRIFKVSNKLIRMLNHIPRKGERIFSYYKNLNSLTRVFQRQRKRIAHKLANPRLMQISFRTIRHWKATMLYYKSKDILFVKEFLGHKDIKNTLVYTQLAKFEDEEEFICKVAKTPQEIAKLIELGFEYVCELDGLKFFRKRK